MNISQLEYFVDAVEEGSYSRAAHKNYVTAQAVSKAVKELEGEFGLTLMGREGRGVSPTSIGLLFCDQARVVLEEYRRLGCIASVHQESGYPPERVSIAVSTAECRGNPCPRRFFDNIEQNNEHLKIRSYYGISAWCRELLRDGFVDVALLLEAAVDDEALTQLYFTAVEPRFAVSSDNPLVLKGGVDAKALNDYQLALPLDVSAVNKLKHWLSAVGSDVRFESVGQAIKDNKAFLESGGVIMVSGDDRFVLPGVDHVTLYQTGDVRLRLPVYMSALRDIGEMKFRKVFNLFKGACGNHIL